MFLLLRRMSVPFSPSQVCWLRKKVEPVASQPWEQPWRAGPSWGGGRWQGSAVSISYSGSCTDSHCGHKTLSCSPPNPGREMYQAPPAVPWVLHCVCAKERSSCGPLPANVWAWRLSPDTYDSFGNFGLRTPDDPAELFLDCKVV